MSLTYTGFQEHYFYAEEVSRDIDITGCTLKTVITF